VNIPTNVTLDETISCDELVVDTPARVISRAIDQEVEQYRAFLSNLGEVERKRRMPRVSYEMFPNLGASVPSIVDLEAPMADMK
jgi:hypothetical protein